MRTFYLHLFTLGLITSSVHAQNILIEAESFDQPGGWKLDTQSIEVMGSPYMLAHGLGTPVKDASTSVEFPQTGEYRVFVRTKDWVARWEAEGEPGRFQIVLNGEIVEKTFGTQGADWHWQDGGTIWVTQTQSKVSLRDLTGFEGRCDAIYFSQDGTPPPNAPDTLPQWRRKLLGLSDAPVEEGNYDLVVIGGGYAGMASALSAARMGCKVALMAQNSSAKTVGYL